MSGAKVGIHSPNTLHFYILLNRPCRGYFLDVPTHPLHRAPDSGQTVLPSGKPCLAFYAQHLPSQPTRSVTPTEHLLLPFPASHMLFPWRGSTLPPCAVTFTASLSFLCQQVTLSDLQELVQGLFLQDTFPDSTQTREITLLCSPIMPSALARGLQNCCFCTRAQCRWVSPTSFGALCRERLCLFLSEPWGLAYGVSSSITCGAKG